MSSWIRPVGTQIRVLCKRSCGPRPRLRRCPPKVEGCGETTGLATGSRRGGPSKPLKTVRARDTFSLVGEPAIVVGDRKELTYLLSQAAELEHGLMCEYLYAAFSLKSTAGPGLRADQLDAVERWRGMIFGIAGEEMLHWAMVQNLLTAVGSAPYVSRPHMPHQARGYPPGVQVRLLPFGEAALQHFVYLERPEGMEGVDAEGDLRGSDRANGTAPDRMGSAIRNSAGRGFRSRSAIAAGPWPVREHPRSTRQPRSGGWPPEAPL